jgi:6-pyruvoyltetrahydropterin/6-carboxytetrahydropterin synthase|tara:strand:+ start:393 stop:845 length:453 start_codon:yes stop_codon:yes gene_type:complete
MKRIRVTKQFTFEMASALPNYDGDCANIHGHSYKLDITVIGEPIEDTSNPKFGMLIDFGDIKKVVNGEIVDKLDHSMVVSKHSAHGNFDPTKYGFGGKIVYTDYQPTVENMLSDFATRLQGKFPKGVELHSIKIRETGTAFAEWFASDNQ